MFVHRLLNRRWFIFCVPYTDALPCVFKISLRNINIAFLCKTSYRLTAGVLTHTAVLCNVWNGIKTLPFGVASTCEKTIHRKSIGVRPSSKILFGNKNNFRSCYQSPFPKISFHICRQWERCFKYRFLKCLYFFYKLKHLHLSLHTFLLF